MSGRLLFLPLCAALLACPPAIDLGDDGGGVITAGPEGGIFVRDGAVIDIPRGALAEKTHLTVMMVQSGIPEVPGRKRVSLGYRFFASASLTFKEPVKIILPYLEPLVPRGVDPGTFDMRRQSGQDAYLQLPGLAVHAEFTAVEAKSDRLGLFWITSPLQAAVSKLTLEPKEAFLRVGDTQQFTATVTDPAGNPLDVALSWSLLPPRVATIDANGLLTATGPGTATVTVRAANESATATVSVQGSTSGPSTFAHENPFPTGNDLWGGGEVAGESFLVGANATVISRSASGAWTRLYSSPGITLRAAGGNGVNEAVAVGTSGTSGVLIEFKGPSVAPVVSLHSSVLPRALAFDGTHGMAVGEGNDVLVRRAGAWVKESSPSIETLHAVAGDGQGAFTTLGGRGSIYRYDPLTRTWNSLFQSQLSVLLTAAVLADASGAEGWAVGGNKLWHFSQGAWSALNLPASPVMNELASVGLMDGKVIIGARAGRQGYLLIYDPPGPLPGDFDAGTADGGEQDGGEPDAGQPDGGSTSGPWTLLPLRGPQVIRGIFGQGSTGWAVGDLGAVYRYSGGTFTELSRGFYGTVADVAVAGSSVFAAVNECTTPACTVRQGKVMTRTGPSSWAPLGSAQPFGGPLFSIAATSPTEVLAGGSGELYRYDGTGWSPVAMLNGRGGPIYDLQFCGMTLFAVGRAGQVFEGNSNTLSALPAVGGSDLRAIHCPTPNQIWLAGDEAIFERNGPGAFVGRSSSTVNNGPWRAIWSPGQGEAFAFGADRYGVYWDTADLSPIDAPGGVLPEAFSGLWGSSVDNLYLVGHSITPFPFGYAVRFDGAQWRLVDSGSQRKVTAIHGSSATEIWLGTEGGGMLRAVP